MVLLHIGGVYIDSDFTMIRPVHPQLSQFRINGEHKHPLIPVFGEETSYALSNGFIMSPPGAIFLKRLYKFNEKQNLGWIFFYFKIKLEKFLSIGNTNITPSPMDLAHFRLSTIGQCGESIKVKFTLWKIVWRVLVLWSKPICSIVWLTGAKITEKSERKKSNNFNCFFEIMMITFL